MINPNAAEIIAEWKSLTSYLAGNRFLLECLELASVADREAIKARLLLLPEA